MRRMLIKLVLQGWWDLGHHLELHNCNLGDERLIEKVEEEAFEDDQAKIQVSVAYDIQR